MVFLKLELSSSLLALVLRCNIVRLFERSIRNRQSRAQTIATSVANDYLNRQIQANEVPHNA